LAAVRHIAYEAADAGLLSPELAAGIRREKGVSSPRELRDQTTERYLGCKQKLRLP
jgi:hypothetical protein